jgi:outer membrane protein assembly factor BamB
LIDILLAATVTAFAHGSDWPTFGHDAARTSNTGADRGLAPKTVSGLRLRWRASLDTVADTAPIFLSHVDAGGRSVAMLFITAKDGTTYGIDASSGRIAWRFATKGPKITTSAPAADPSGRWIYAAGVDGYVHKLAAATGSEVRSGGFPVQVTRIPRTEKDASSLNVANGYLYAVTSGYYGDAPPYVGHVVAIRLSDGTAHVFNTLCSRQRSLPTESSCSQSGSGIWARAGAVVDPDPAMDGRIYVTTGNGDFDANHGGDDYGDSVLSLTRDATKLVGYYTPGDYEELDSGDVDLGTVSPVLLPRQVHSRTPLLAVQAGKDGILRLLDRTHLGGVDGELQRIDLGGRVFAAPATWRDERGTSWIYFGMPDGVRSYRLVTDSSGKSRLEEGWSTSAGNTEEGTSPVVSNGVVFVAMDGAIYALDALTGAKLWNSAQSGAGSSIGDTHWESPIVVDDWVFCADEDGRISAFAL